jgi:hypothetical protein
MNVTEYGTLVAAGLFIGMLAAIEMGRRFGFRTLARNPQKKLAGFRSLENGVFGLMGLLFAFTFSSAAVRFDARRQLVIQEANYIGTAYLRISLLPKDAQPDLRNLFRQYLDSRIETYQKLPDLVAAEAVLERSRALQLEIWNHALAACDTSRATPPYMLVLPALNAMIDITTTRTEVIRIHPPLIVFVMLVALCLAASALAGYDMAENPSRSWLHILALTTSVVLTVYVIIDLEYPRLGLIRVQNSDQVLYDLRTRMN